MKRFATLAGILLLAALAALAQEPDSTGTDLEDENGFLINMLTNAISAPGREISLSGVTGALSSQARIERIRISDDRGPWLEIDNVELDWSRLALLRRQLNVSRLSAERIAWLRRAEMPPRPPLSQPEARPFALPELPVSIRLDELQVGSITFAEDLFGQAAELSVDGNLSLAGGTLDSTLEIVRQDAPGGELDVDAAFSNETRELALDVQLTEPPGGLVAELLNIEGDPAIELSLSGAGPIDDVDIELALDAGGVRMATGQVALRGGEDGLAFDADLSGEIAPLIPADFRDFFAGESAIRASGMSKASGGIRIDQVSVQGAVLDLSGSAETGPDNFLQSLNLSGTLGDPADPPVVLPVPGAATRLNSAVLRINYGDASRWDGFVVLDRLETAGISMEDVTLTLGGLARNIQDPETRDVTVTVEGLATGLWSDDPNIAAALGERIDLFADAALPPDAPIELRQVQLSGNGLSVFAAGQLADLVYSGRISTRIANLGILSGLAGRELGGELRLRADGEITPLSGGFDLTFDGGANNVRTGDLRLDGLLSGATTLSGRAVRDETGIRTEDLRIDNPQLTFASDGRISSASTDFGFQARLEDLAVLDPRLAGTVTADGRATGTGGPIDVSLSAEIPQGRLADQAIEGLGVGFDGQIDGSDVSGTLDGGGAFADLPFELDGQIEVAGERKSLSGFNLVVGPNSLAGDISQTGDAPIEGRISLRAPDIGSLAALALVEANGSAQADVMLSAAESGQGLGIDAQLSDLAYGGNVVESVDLNATLSDLFGLPMIDGELAARGIVAGGFDVAAVNASASQRDAESMQFAADARLANGTLADLGGTLERRPGGFAATLESLRLRQDPLSAELSAPSTVTMQDGAIELTPLALDFGTGSLTASGRIADELDLSVDIETLPLDLANAIRPDLGLAGVIDGTARVTGTRAAPDANFDVTATDVAAAATRSAGLPPISATATGRTSGGNLDLDMQVTSGGGLGAQVSGSVPIAGGDIDLAVDLNTFPLQIVDRLAGDQGLRGTVSGNAAITGTPASPAASFDLEGTGITARPAIESGLPAVDAALSGTYSDGAIEIASARLSGPPGLDVSGSGRVPFSGPGLDVNLSGAMPLALVNPLLEQRSAQATGLLRIDASASGSLAAPQYGGDITIDDGTFIYPDLNLRLENIRLGAGLQGTELTIRELRSDVAAGGTISAQGTVSLAPGSGFPAGIETRFDQVRYTDGAFVTTEISGNLSLNGPVMDGGRLTGRIDLGRTEISVAEGFGSAGGLDPELVQHLRPPPRVVETLERAGIGEREEDSGPRSGGLQLDIQINAPNRIFVRGRGLDAEVGGSLTIRGTTQNVQPVGEFEMRRGRIIILTQRIEFTEGRVTLVGDLDPVLDFVASSSAGDITAIVSVQGRASDPDITFSSQPELPQDEVLAQLLFGVSASDLSAFQLAQLAAAAAELAGGGGGPGILNQISSAAGLDELDIVTEEGGATAVRAGKYINENTYLDVQTDSEGVTRAEIVLELSESVTVRGATGSDGNSIFGLFYERDY